MATVRHFWDVSGLLSFVGVPWSVREQIRASESYSSEEEMKLAVLQYCLQTVPGVSWGLIAGVCWRLNEHEALETVRKYLQDKHGQ